MTAWTREELDEIGNAVEIQIAPRRRDGTLRNPVTIWVVRLDDDLYIRSYRGSTAAWFRAAQVRHEGRIRAGGVEKDVNLVDETDPTLNDRIDAAYRAKYRHHAAAYVDPMVAPEARATTMRLLPRATSADPPKS